jgi:hypothetical protein
MPIRFHPRPSFISDCAGWGGASRVGFGHFHLLIDTELPPLDRPIPNDFNHPHFDARQTEAEVSLSPCEYTLQLLLGDKAHIPHSPPDMSESIRVRAAEAGAATVAVHRRPAPPNARVYFVYPRDGAFVPGLRHE